jgi:hypothetical protein
MRALVDFAYVIRDSDEAVEVSFSPGTGVVYVAVEVWETGESLNGPRERREMVVDAADAEKLGMQLGKIARRSKRLEKEEKARGND